MTASRLRDALDVSYKSALSFAHRFGMANGAFSNIKRTPLMNYPYQARPSESPGGGLVLSIYAALPPGLPQEMREEVCQELALAVLCGDVDAHKIACAVPRYISAYNRLYTNRWADVSLDDIVPGTDDLRYVDRLSGDNSHDYWERR